MEKKALGRGLKALIGEPEDSVHYEPSSGNYIAIDLIEPNPLQPRETFDIKADGVLQPIIVRQVGDKYQIIAGERRWRAARKIGLLSVPATIRDATDTEMLKIALIENLQRQDLNPIEEANAYKTLIDLHDITQETLARYVGKDRSTITNILRLLGLPTQIQAHVSRGTISMGHARALLAVDDSSTQIDLCDQIIAKGLSVRQVEKLVKRGIRPRRTPPAQIDPDIRRVEDELQRALGTKVRIRSTGKRGKLEILFSSPDQLQGIIGRFLEERP
jgi:ParB family chromosome partitioning protein